MQLSFCMCPLDAAFLSFSCFGVSMGYNLLDKAVVQLVVLAFIAKGKDAHSNQLIVTCCQTAVSQ